MTDSLDTDTTPLSAIKLFDKVRRGIKKINTPPLTDTALEVNLDAQAELGDDTDDSVVFARIGLSFPERYTNLAFEMLFMEHGAALAYGAQEHVYADYEQLGDDEVSVAKALLAILTALANGQIAILATVTEGDERTQAWELLYRKPGATLYDALATYAMFESERKLRGVTLVTQKFANTATIADTAVPLDALQAFMFETNWLNKFNRTQIRGLHIPLTRADWSSSIDKYYDDKAQDYLQQFIAPSQSGSRTFKQLLVDSLRWRHLELMWWSWALLLYKPVAEWSWDYFNGAIVCYGIFVLLATIYRRDKRLYKYYTSIRATAYVGYILSLVVYAFLADYSLVWYVLGAVSLLSLCENIIGDIYFRRQKAARA